MRPSSIELDVRLIGHSGEQPHADSLPVSVSLCDEDGKAARSLPDGDGKAVLTAPVGLMSVQNPGPTRIKVNLTHMVQGHATLAVQIDLDAVCQDRADRGGAPPIPEAHRFQQAPAFSDDQVRVACD